MTDQEIVTKLAQKLYERKASDIVALRVGHLTVLCDYMLIASGRTAAQVSAMVDEADELMSELGITLRRSEGANEGRWAVLDYGSVMVHLFHKDEREYYRLERLWNDGTNEIELPLDQTLED